MSRIYNIIYEINNVIFAVDEKNRDEIIKNLKAIRLDVSKMKDLYFDLIVKGTCSKDKYSQENYSNVIENVTALKFKGKSKNNSRIYCKDFKKENKRIIILCEFHKKKQNKLLMRERSIISRINKHEY